MKNIGFVPVTELRYSGGSSVYIPKKELKDYNLRVVRSGNVIEVYQYEKKVYYDYEYFERNVDRQRPDNWHGKEDKSLARARREIRRIIWCNLNKYSKFLTLTYKENMQDIQQFYYDWQIFTTNMKRKGYRLNYLYVLEHQKERGIKYNQGEGAIHAHVVIFNDEYIPWEVIKTSWKHGVIDLHKIRDIGNLGAYVCKYLTKDALAEYNSKSYHCSQGLKRSVERKITLTEGESLIEELFAHGEVVFTSEYDITVNDIVSNQVKYCQIKITD